MTMKHLASKGDHVPDVATGYENSANDGSKTRAPVFLYVYLMTSYFVKCCIRPPLVPVQNHFVKILKILKTYFLLVKVALEE